MPLPSDRADRFVILDLLPPGSGFIDRLVLLVRPREPVPGRPDPSPEPSRGAAPEREVEQALRGAQRSLRFDRPLEAAAWFAQALRHVPGADPRRAAIRHRQADALLRAAAPLRAARAYGAAARCAPAGEARADLKTLQAEALAAAGRFGVARRVARAALDGARSAVGRSRARRALARVLARSGAAAEAERLLRRSLVDLDLDGPGAAGELARTRRDLGLVAASLEHDEAATLLEQAVGALAGAQDDAAALPARAGAILRSAHGGPDLESFGEDCRRHGRLRLLEATLSSLAAAARQRGRVDAARRLAGEALGVAEQIGDPDLVLVDRCRAAEALRVSGRSAAAADLLRLGLKEYPFGASTALADVARAMLGAALADGEPGDAEAAGQLLQRATSALEKAFPAWASLVPVVLELERLARPASREPQEPVWLAFVARESLLRDEPELRARARLARAACRLERGDAAAALRLAAEAEPLAVASRQRLLQCEARALEFAAAREVGSPDQTRRARERALGLLDRILEDLDDDHDREALAGRAPFRDLRRPRVADAADRRLLTLYKMIRTLNTESDPDALLQSILDMALHAVRAERGLILLQDRADEFTVRLARNLGDGPETDFESFSRHVVQEASRGSSLLVVDAAADERFRDSDSVSRHGIRSLMCVPLRTPDGIAGAVYLDSRRDAGLFSRDDLRFLEAFAGHATIALDNLRRRTRLERENRRLQAASDSRVRFGNLVGRSTAMQRVFDLIEKFAASELPVLIRGESGTGKELVARAIHRHGPRRLGPFLSENCAAIPDTLLESELFGHVRGAFTGAERDRPGLFEQADGGTLFLDEIGETSAAMQAKLLRVLEERQVRRVGSNRPVRTNVRILAATHRDLDGELLAGRFREDLYYRLQVLVAHVPPLRERPEDILPLTDHFLERISGERGMAVPRPAGAVLELFERYRWPGNVRQLENTLQRLCLLAGDGPITLATLQSDRELGQALLPAETRREPALSLAGSERQRIREALSAAGGNRERAAQLLGISRATIYRKIRQHRLG